MAYTKGPEDAITIAREASNSFTKIVSVGGDGTLNEVVNGIAGSGAILGVIPAGTGNDFAKTIYQNLDIDNIIETIIEGEVKSIDIGKCNNKYFINIASAGIDAEIAHRVQRIKKSVPGKTVYLNALFKTLASYKGIDFNIKLDDVSFKANTLLITASNGKYYGGGMIPTPDADIRDGYFDVCHIKNLNKLKIIAILYKFIKGNHTSLKEVTIFKTKRLTIKADKKFFINIDGETLETNEANLELYKDFINIVLPKNKDESFEI
ncbi:diacylglycerol/lipid kinase family protein [Caloramator sp. Dgby_cultured_2]|uniref:diacylglycerol/lipid kinase family protein n=1 Tax=Caloramator sp. Dgby_cultured_2 TaxID=3029174 RepID=UPI00237ED442|nr:diacylglycerol kinase family protein [Caloramator sp. Dgby_cultured_2]WDU84559.1 diacylglycerol kinase family lipid kinase [Caloramator sp. Dgby_cultured_2]